MATERDLRIIELVGRGWTDERIARDLRVSRTSAQRYLRTLARRLGAVSRATLVVRALQEGLIDLATVQGWEVERTLPPAERDRP